MIKKEIKKILGVSILEALVSTLIIGIGFVAILQMTNYSVQSMQTSGDRTKANYLTNVIAEDVISSRRETTGAFDNFSNYLMANQLNADVCSSAAGTASSNTGQIYGDGSGSLDAPVMKFNKWQALLNSKTYLNCKGKLADDGSKTFNETRQFRVFKICGWNTGGGCLENGNMLYNGRTLQDDAMYIGRVQINLNQGKKRKYLYFQTDYKLVGVND
tara:strand:+ start:297 stop:944 length:648 start_codon:yes stop_codon:yes gene_type:complete